MNQVIRNSEVEEILKSYEEFKDINPLSNGHVPTHDAKIKWAGILEAAKQYCVNPVTMLDAGCGPSNLALAVKNQFSTLQKIYCFDIEPISSLLSSQEFCVCVQSDFFDACTNVIKDESVDLIVDACSVTHFDVSSNISYNDGCYRLAKEAKRILKDEGIFITCSDFSLAGNKSGEFLCVESMIESYKKGGLELVDDNVSFDLQDAFVANQRLNLGIVRLIFRKARN